MKSFLTVDNMKIIVIYKSTYVDRKDCPECVRKVGKHIPAFTWGEDKRLYWNIKEITDAVNN